MRIGLDLDHAVYGFPKFFSELITSMAARGHTFHCTSGHSPRRWERRDIELFERLGIDHRLVDPSLLVNHYPNLRHGGAKVKANMYRVGCLDLVFDDDAHKIQKFTRVPLFEVPKFAGMKGQLKGKGK